MTRQEAALREHLAGLLDSGSAHLRFDDIVADWPDELRGTKPEGAAHTPWQVLEHLRICQWDIVEFSRSAGHVSPDFPAGYWPKTSGPPSPDAWEKSIAEFRSNMSAMRELAGDPARDLFEPFPWGNGQTLLREATLIADHNAYHLGELMVLKRLLGIVVK